MEGSDLLTNGPDLEEPEDDVPDVALNVTIPWVSKNQVKERMWLHLKLKLLAKPVRVNQYLIRPKAHKDWSPW